MFASEDIKTRARELGFDLCGIAPAGVFPELSRLRHWIDKGYSGEMAYMARTAEDRSDVRKVMPSAKTVVVLGTLYNTDRPYSTEIEDAGEALISRYAWGDDYHEVIGSRTKALCAWMHERYSPSSFESRVYVDTGPIQERVYAQYAGLGWIGKNTCLINADLGSWLFLSEVVCSLSLAPDSPSLDQCGSCTLCLDACPTSAFPEPGVLDATRCISYLTIEKKSTISQDQRGDLGSHIYGCDVCQEVCPYNTTAPISDNPAWQPRPLFDRQRLAELWLRSDTELRNAIKRGPMTRVRLKRFRRNLVVAMGNSGSREAQLALDSNRARLPDTESLDEPIVAEHLVWAREKLSGDPGNED